MIGKIESEFVISDVLKNIFSSKNVIKYNNIFSLKFDNGIECK